MAVYQTELIARPEFYLCIGARVADFSATDLEQLQLLMDLEISTLDPEEEVIVLLETSSKHKLNRVALKSCRRSLMKVGGDYQFQRDILRREGLFRATKRWGQQAIMCGKQWHRLAETIYRKKSWSFVEY